MKQSALTKATLGRLPGYLQYLQKQGFQPGDTISATTIARELRLGRGAGPQGSGRGQRYRPSQSGL